MNSRIRLLAARLPSILLSIGLHLSPLLRTSSGAAALSPVLFLTRWLCGAAAVTGAMHAVSGATGLTLTQGGKSVKSSTGTNSVVFAGTRITVRSDLFGNALSYEFDGLPTGLVGSAQGVVTGIPTDVGEFPVTVTGWQRSGFSGFNFTSSYTVVIVEGTPTAPPQITTPPQPQSGAPGDSITLSVSASGIALSYQWIRNGQDLPGQIASTLVLSPLQVSDAGSYQVRVSNSVGSATSTAATVRVITPIPVVPLLPLNRSLYAGEDLSLDATSTGVEPISYQWMFNGLPLVGETNPTLLRAAVNAATAPGSYTALVTDGAGVTATAGPVAVSVIPLPSLHWIQFVQSVGGALGFDAEVGRTYRLEGRTLVGSGNWSEVATVTAIEPVLRWEVASPSAEAGFFRVVVLPPNQ